MAIAESEPAAVLKSFSTAFENVTSECKEDHVGLWSVVREVQEDFSGVPSSKIKDIALVLIRLMLKTGGVRAGFPAANGRDFSSWTLQPDETIERISDEWDRLGREPSGGEIVWFTALPDAQPA